MNDSYVPTTADVRRGYTADRGEMVRRNDEETLGSWLSRQHRVTYHALAVFSAEAFERWLTAHDAAVWHEGFVAGAKDEDDAKGNPTHVCTPNPYRKVRIVIRDDYGPSGSGAPVVAALVAGVLLVLVCVGVVIGILAVAS